jgi:hypothetical protein
MDIYEREAQMVIDYASLGSELKVRAVFKQFSFTQSRLSSWVVPE